MIDLQPFLPLLDQFAPTIGGLIGGPAGRAGSVMAVAAIHALADALETDPTAPDVASKLNTMPTVDVPGALLAAEEALVSAIPASATSTPAQTIPGSVLPPAPAQGLYVDPINSLIKAGVGALAVMFAAKFGVDVATAQSWGGMFVPGLECLANLAMGGLSGFSLWRSVSGANANTKAIQAQKAA
jgi:hypothetical protein